jgi:hypothetical protein
MKSILRTLSVTLISLLLVACGRKEPAPAAQSGGHVHTAPHGGTLIEVGDHAYNLELLRDSASGKLTVWVLDGHAENFVRIKAATIEAAAAVGGEKKTLSLKAVANAATGETVGDTSQFEVQADWLKGAAPIEVTVPSVEIKGRRFERLSGKVGIAAK